MSGHSHWATVKHKKGLEDAKRGKIFSKLNREVSVAVREGGPNPDHNTKLRMLIEKARQYNMPKDNIERIIKKISGGEEAEILESFLFEMIGPGEAAILIEGITDNKNRTLGELKRITTKFDAKLVGEGALKWQFSKKGMIEIEADLTKKEELEMTAIEAGADDIEFGENSMTIYTTPENIDTVRKALEAGGLKVKSFSIVWVANEEKTITPEQQASLEKLFEALDDNDDVQELYTNVNF